jgi:penicillin-binding protein 1A
LGAKYLYMGGLSIHTTVDRHMQNAAENTVASHVKSLGYRGIAARDAALVSVEPATGAIRAYVGGVDFERNQINMANQPRQPGSAIKPLYYAGALNEGIIYPDTKINNKPRRFGDYQPENDSASSPAATDMRSALINSYNVASVEILNLLGVDEGVDYIENFGVTTITDADKNLTLALGGMSKGISPLQMAAAFAVFPNQGVYQEPYLVQTITDVNDRIIYKSEQENHRVITRTVAGLMTDILQQAVRYGTGTSAAIAITSAGKTGTTTDSRDLWYVGYIDELATAVWVGNSDNTPVTGYRSYGGAVAAPILA